MDCPFAIQHPGPPGKVNPGHRIGEGVVLHSAEGSLAGTLRQLDGPAEVSWHFTVTLDGTLYQHYPVETQCWHAHAYGNLRFVGVEHENQYTDGHPDHRPFTDAQVMTDVGLIQWLSSLEGWAGFDRRVNLWEHNEIPGNQTSCPSGRVPWGAIITGLTVPPPVVPAGIGVHYTDGQDAEIWRSFDHEGRTLDGVGMRYSDGTIERIWPK